MEPTHKISLEKAREMTKRFREKKQELNPSELLNCETFDRAAFDRLLNQPGCTGIRLYYGLDDALQLHAVFVGVTDKNEDMISSKDTDPEIVDEGLPCPPNCPPPSELNT